MKIYIHKYLIHEYFHTKFSDLRYKVIVCIYYIESTVMENNIIILKY